MKISDNGINFLKHQEGEKLSAYPDPATGGKPWTIGVGHTGYVDGKEVSPGMTITAQKSSELLRQDLEWVEKCISDNVKKPLTQNQYDALCSFIFNIGPAWFKRSQVLEQINKGNYKAAADAFLNFTRAGGNPTLLKPRRLRERELFLS